MKQNIYFTDTHCHIHDSVFFPVGGDAEYERALVNNVHRMVVVGTDVRSSQEAVNFANSHDNAYAIVGIHPHEAAAAVDDNGVDAIRRLITDNSSHSSIIGIGEIGLDYFYLHSPVAAQQQIFQEQIDIAREFHLPVSFHVRDSKTTDLAVFDDFWPLFDNFRGISGVLHSFTDTTTNLEKGLSRGLYIGINGISTFARDVRRVVYQAPLSRVLFETDAPYLTPSPYRDRINEPMYVRDIAQYFALQRSIDIMEVSDTTEENVNRLFFAQ